MPGVFIGIGGIGGNIVSKVRRSLEVKKALAGDTPSAQEAASQFRFLLVDTWKDGVTQGFDAAECFDFPEGRDKFEVDAKVDSWYHSGDPWFRAWWPSNNGSPLTAGAYASGAGQLRVKGRLAYRIGLTGLGREFAPSVLEALRAIDTVKGPAPDIRTVPIYLVCSLGGGTGSGMVLTLAQHLRQTLPEYCPLVGVFPLASVTEMGPGQSDKLSIWANTDAALREIDYFQHGASTVRPFFQWPGSGNEIDGARRPFEYVFLFGRDNENGQSLKTFAEYEDLIAEALIAESFSSLIDEGLQNGIRGPHSQFIMQLQEKPLVKGRPTTYASAAVGALVYPAERIERHLARRFALSVLGRMTEVRDDVTRAEKDEFVKQHNLTFEPLSIDKELKKPAMGPTGKLVPLPPPPPVLGLGKGMPFALANPTAAQAMAKQARDDLGEFANRQYAQHLRTRSKETLLAYSGPAGTLRTQVSAWLGKNGPNALGQTFAIVDALKRELDHQWDAANKRIEGDEKEGKPGIRRELAELQSGFDGKVAAMLSKAGGGFLGISNKHGLQEKTKFLNAVWIPYQAKVLELETAIAARKLLRELAAETATVEQGLKSLVSVTNRLREDLTVSTTHDVGEHGNAGVLDLHVLDDPRLVAHRFDKELNEAIRQWVDDCAIRVTVPPATEEDALVLAPAGETEDDGSGLSGLGVVAAALQKALDPKSGSVTLQRDQYRDHLEAAIVADGVRHLGEQVQALSIWDALAAECKARQALGLADAAVVQADSQVRSDRQAAERAGVPPKDWEAEVLQAFIRNRLFECQKRVRPFWNLNGLMTSNHGRPYLFTVLATDEHAYRLAEASLGIRGVLERTSELLQAGTPKWLPGRDRIVLYSREGVAPLFYLNEWELKQMRDSSSQKEREKFLYVDRRFEDVVEKVVRPAETAEETAAYAIGIGLALGIVKHGELGDDPYPDLLFELEGEGVSFANLCSAIDAVVRHAELRHALYDLDDSAMAEKNDNKRSETQHEALQYAHQMVKQVKATTKLPRTSEEEDCWRMVERTILQRINYGLPFVRG